MVSQRFFVREEGGSFLPQRGQRQSGMALPREVKVEEEEGGGVAETAEEQD